MEGIKDKREGEKSPLQRLHFEVRPSAAGIVTSFNTPAQQEGIEGCTEMLWGEKNEKGQKRREERQDRSHLCFKGAECLQEAVCCGGSGRVSVCVGSWFDLAPYFVQDSLHINKATCETLPRRYHIRHFFLNREQVKQCGGEMQPA